MDRTFRYSELDRDLEGLNPAEQACVLAMFVQLWTSGLHYAARLEQPGDKLLDTYVELFGRLVNCLNRLAAILNDGNAHLQLRNLYASAGRQVELSEKWYGSFCNAAESIGAEYFTAIFRAADVDEYRMWLIGRAHESGHRRYPSIDGRLIREHWSDVGTALAELPEVQFDKLENGISNEHIEVQKHGEEMIGPQSRTEWAKQFGVSVATFDRWRRIPGKLRCEAPTTHNIRIHRDDVERHSRK